MLPYIEIFGKFIPMYGVCFVIGMGIAVLTAFLLVHKYREVPQIDVSCSAIYAGIGALVGAKALFLIVNLDRIIDGSLTIMQAFQGGFVFYGGLIGAFVCGVLYLKVRKIPLEAYMDNAALFAPLFHGFARIGCFLSGCCYGIEHELGFADVSGKVRFPVQLLESACNFIIAAVIFFILKKGLLRGKAFYLYLAIYAFVRFFDEFLRGDEIRGFVLGLSTSQFISIFIELFALAMILVPIIKRKLKT